MAPVFEVRVHEENARDGGEAQSEAEKNDLILFSRRLEDESAKRKQVDSVSEFVNLQVDKDDALVTGQSAYGCLIDRYQGTKEQVKKKVGKGMAGGQATIFVDDDDALSKMDIARDLNRHGEVVLRGRPKGDDSKQRKTTAAMIAEKEDKDALEDRLKKDFSGK